MLLKNKESVVRITNPDKNEFVKLWKEYRPFLIEGAAKNWDAYKNWSNDYLSNKCGNNNILVDADSNKPLEEINNYEYASEEFYQKEEIKFQDYIDWIGGDQKEFSSRYLAQINFEEYFPQITADVNYPYFFNRKPEVGFWFGCSGTNSHLHFDNTHNIFAQIRGRKRILLFAPTNYLSFYPPLGESGAMLHFSKVNPLEPNFELFPDFPHRKQQEIILEAGEILYIPPFWWHCVIGIDETISLSFWHNITIRDFFKQKGMILTALNILRHSKTPLFM